MGKIYSVANQKGGVGKTTTAVNLAAALAAMEYKILLVDLDPQGNATSGSGVDKTSLQTSALEVLGDKLSASKAIIPTESGFDVLPANRRLARLEEDLLDRKNKALRLAKTLEKIKDDYDVILIDCPPSLSILTINSLCASQGLIIPITCEYFSLEGVSDLIDSVGEIVAEVNKKLDISCLLRVRFDPRLTLQRDVSDRLAEFFKDYMYETVIPVNVRLAEAPSYGQPGVLYDPSSRGAQAYKQFAEEFVRREGLQPANRKRKFLDD